MGAQGGAIRALDRISHQRCEGTYSANRGVGPGDLTKFVPGSGTAKATEHAYHFVRSNRIVAPDSTIANLTVAYATRFSELLVARRSQPDQDMDADVVGHAGRFRDCVGAKRADKRQRCHREGRMAT
jgi:hypothetical protein